MFDIILPKNWEKWTLTELLGEGAYGEVYKAECTLDDTVLYSAIKVIRIPSNNDEFIEYNQSQLSRALLLQEAKECLKEIKVMEQLKGVSTIVSVEDSEMVENTDSVGWTIFIRMQLLESFQHYQCDHQLSEKDVIKLGMDISQALIECRKKNIIHRDIKPSNIFVSPDGVFKLGDFGVARMVDSTSHLSIKGTFSYIAPESVNGKAYDHRSDIYSLGLVLYKLMNNNLDPFISRRENMLPTQKEKESSTSRRLSGEALPPPANASPALSQIILKACEYEPRKRFSEPEEMFTALQKLYYSDKKTKQVSSHKSLRFAFFILLIILCLLAPALLKKQTNDEDLSQLDFSSPAPAYTTVPDNTIAPTDSPEETNITPEPEPTSEDSPAIPQPNTTNKYDAEKATKDLAEKIYMYCNNTDFESFYSLFEGYSKETVESFFDYLRGYITSINKWNVQVIASDDDKYYLSDIVYYVFTKTDNGKKWNANNVYYDEMIYIAQYNSTWKIVNLESNPEIYETLSNNAYALLPEGYRDAATNNRNAIQLYKNWNWNDSKLYYDEDVGGEAVFLYENEDGSLDIIMHYWNGTNIIRTFKKSTITVTDSSLGKLFSITIQPNLVVAPHSSTVYTYTIKKGKYKKGTWDTIHCNFKNIFTP